jgi:class 3 adenylate cyclase/tetratricopeptide (TPR) repeat protein
MAVSRRLVAVVVADVVGYSRLMERDEAGTHQRLRALSAELIRPKTAEHGGRIVKTTGDGMLLEFPSATSALRCAVEIQREMAARNLQVAPHVRIEFRIGINLGDIIVEGDDIIGDGVNVAARLEALADPGGICVAAAVWEQVREDLGVDFVDSGEQRVKNISKPIRVFRVVLDKHSNAPSAPRAAQAPRWRSQPTRAALWGATALLSIGVVVAAWRVLNGGAADAALPLRSTMIVPFTASGGDAALAANALRLGADVTHALADSVRHVRVVPPETASAYADKSADARVLGRDANVRFLVRTHLQRDGAQITTTIRVVDTRDGSQVEHVRKTFEAMRLGDNRALVWELASAIRQMLATSIARAVPSCGKDASAEDLVDCAMGLAVSDQVANAREMRRLMDVAIKLDPNLARARIVRAAADVDIFFNDFAADAATLVAQADDDTLRAVTLDPKDSSAWVTRSNALRIRGNLAGAALALDRAEELDPTRYSVSLVRGFYYLDAGRPVETLKLVEKLRPVIGTHLWALAMQACSAHLNLGQYEQAIAECERAGTTGDDWNAVSNLAAAYAMHGDAQKAAVAKDKLLKLAPTFTIARYKARFHATVAPEAVAMDEEHYISGLRKAGVPE